MVGIAVMVRTPGSRVGQLYIAATDNEQEALNLIGLAHGVVDECEVAVSLTSDAMVRFFSLEPGQVAVASFERDPP